MCPPPHHLHPPSLPSPPRLSNPCPRRLLSLPPSLSPSPLCLCSHHNKPGADGASALLCLAHGDRQPLSANSLPGNQLTGLDSARCCCNSSSTVGGGGGGGVVNWKQGEEATAAADETESWSDAAAAAEESSAGCSRSTGGRDSPHAATCVSPPNRGTDRDAQAAREPLWLERIPPTRCIVPSIPDALIWTQEPSADWNAKGESSNTSGSDIVVLFYRGE